jgi:hypothetical protein
VLDLDGVRVGLVLRVANEVEGSASRQLREGYVVAARLCGPMISVNGKRGGRL